MRFAQLYGGRVEEWNGGGVEEWKGWGALYHNSAVGRKGVEITQFFGHENAAHQSFQVVAA